MNHKSFAGEKPVPMVNCVYNIIEYILGKNFIRKYSSGKITIPFSKISV